MERALTVDFEQLRRKFARCAYTEHRDTYKFHLKNYQVLKTVKMNTQQFFSGDFYPAPDCYDNDFDKEFIKNLRGEVPVRPWQLVLEPLPDLVMETRSIQLYIGRKALQYIRMVADEYEGEILYRSEDPQKQVRKLTHILTDKMEQWTMECDAPRDFHGFAYKINLYEDDHLCESDLVDCFGDYHQYWDVVASGIFALCYGKLAACFFLNHAGEVDDEEKLDFGMSMITPESEYEEFQHQGNYLERYLQVLPEKMDVDYCTDIRSYSMMFFFLSPPGRCLIEQIKKCNYASVVAYALKELFEKGLSFPSYVKDFFFEMAGRIPFDLVIATYNSNSNILIEAPINNQIFWYDIELPEQEDGEEDEEML